MEPRTSSRRSLHGPVQPVARQAQHSRVQRVDETPTGLELRLLRMWKLSRMFFSLRKCRRKEITAMPVVHVDRTAAADILRALIQVLWEDDKNADDRCLRNVCSSIGIEVAVSSNHDRKDNIEVRSGRNLRAPPSRDATRTVVISDHFATPHEHCTNASLGARHPQSWVPFSSSHELSASTRAGFKSPKAARK